MNKLNIKKHPFSFLLRVLVFLSAAITFLILVFIIIYILVNGVPNLNLGLFSLKYTTDNLSLMPALYHTLMMIFLSLLIAVPFGLFSAIFLVEYAKRGNRVVKYIRLAAETLTGIPSIVYGLFGMLLFNIALGWGYSLLSGAFTLAIMILPLILRTAEEALMSVTDSYREGSFGLGAGKLRTVFRIILPAAMPGILSGVILSIGRIIGESAALLFTAGTVTNYYAGVMDSGRTLAVHLYTLASEGLHTEEAYAVAVVLLVIAVVINLLSGKIIKKLTKGGE